LPVLGSERARALCARYGVLTGRELEARVDVLLEQYDKVVEIEARTMITMLRTQVLPAALRAQAELAQAVSTTVAAGVDCPDSKEQLRDLTAQVAGLRTCVQRLEQAVAHDRGSTRTRAAVSRDEIVPAMAAARAAADQLETIVPDDLWPLPTYAEMLFIR
jgi:glutamine synthetase